jgi:hypothetical protein
MEIFKKGRVPSLCHINWLQLKFPLKPLHLLLA